MRNNNKPGANAFGEGPMMGHAPHLQHFSSHPTLHLSPTPQPATHARGRSPSPSLEESLDPLCSDGEEDYEFFREEDLPQRTSSAPPILEVQEQSLFAMGNSYAHFFADRTDIRCDESYLHFYVSYNDPSKLPAPLEGLPVELSSPLGEDILREPYSPSGGSPPMSAKFLPYAERDLMFSPKWSRPTSKRVGSISSLEDFSLDENALIPDLSSDSESVSSSVDDLPTLLQNFGLQNGHPSSLVGPEKFGQNRYLWEASDNPGDPAGAANGLSDAVTVSSVEQGLEDLEVSGDMPATRRREPQRGQSSSSSAVPCRYYSQGYCSRGDRCNFAHVEGETNWTEEQSQNTASQEGGPAPSSQPQGKTTAGRGGKKAAAGSNASSNAGHRRRHSSVITPAAHPPGFVMGTNTLAGRFTSIEQVIGQIYPMCKDQHGCRFLQKKLDEKNRQVTDTIFNEVYPHFAELMTDPFGNYLCQKLLEHCAEKQRLMLIESVAGDLVRVSQNMHGTRAVQKMIECLQNAQEIRLVTRGLKNSVVTLIKDLNGNHVVQRCLNHLSAQDNQFIYDSVAGHCVEVATHRHGCCVLQRCIDHASESQKVQLVTEITVNALTLVKDPYGNYVVQYVLDLPYPRLLAGLVYEFKTHLAELSTQKFSSNVVEKCLNVADPVTRHWMIEEITDSDQLKNLIQDPFGNYVVQTAMTVGDPSQHKRLVEGIKPFLYALRNTPYGKRIQNRILKDVQHKTSGGGNPTKGGNYA
ncbi:hypothetical protein QOT17_002998 [Balamuthia mandrillaris]